MSRDERFARIAKREAHRLTSQVPGAFEDAVQSAWVGMLACADDANDGVLTMAARHQITEDLRHVSMPLTCSRDTERAFRRTRRARDEGQSWESLAKQTGVKKGYLPQAEFERLAGRVALDDVDSTIDDFTLEFDEQDTFAQALDLIEQLLDSDRELLTRFLAGEASRAIAPDLGVSHMTVARRVNSMLEKIREEVAV